MRTITAQSASLLASLETVWGIVFGVLLLGDILTASTFLWRSNYPGAYTGYLWHLFRNGLAGSAQM